MRDDIDCLGMSSWPFQRRGNEGDSCPLVSNRCATRKRAPLVSTSCALQSWERDLMMTPPPDASRVRYKLAEQEPFHVVQLFSPPQRFIRYSEPS
jgi:hypothetical protein